MRVPSSQAQPSLRAQIARVIEEMRLVVKRKREGLVSVDARRLRSWITLLATHD